MAITPEEYINQATSPEDRLNRKKIMFPWLYGASPATMKRAADSILSPRQAQRLLNNFNRNFRRAVNGR